ncbi:hypothetical protein TrST_g6845 [Triparma strigata]|uniref:SUF system FeS cluster assembly SufBD core domain-containing protein n=1 Tax=Triparma strigata TaxID=1606541 RepID=A0A9W6ZPB3_9STRA|nr:hypothetical protein TrST_g6845 [Triparma strigata]
MMAPNDSDESDVIYSGEVLTEMGGEDLAPYKMSKADRRADDWFQHLLESSLTDASSLSPPKAKIYELLTSKPQTPALEIAEKCPNLLAKGCERYNVPIIRKRAEAWRHFDVDGVTNQDFDDAPTPSNLTPPILKAIEEELRSKKIIVDEVSARLVYVNDVFVPSLSQTSDSPDFKCYSESDVSKLNPELSTVFSYLPDGVSDDFPYKSTTTRNRIPLSVLSGKDHMVGPYNGQGAVNNQQGTGCFAALNSVKCKEVAVVDVQPNTVLEKPVHVIRCYDKEGVGGATHPRTILNAGDGSVVDFVQQIVDVEQDLGARGPSFFNGYTQAVVGAGANVTHSFVDESGGVFEADVENDEGAREQEMKRTQIQNTLFETISAHVNGENGSFETAMIGSGGHGRSRVCLEVHLLEEGSHAGVKGLVMSGGVQRVDMRTNIHHIASGCTSRQSQRNLVGGRSGATFKGRIRVEQSAQQTDSEQLARSLLLNEKSRVWCIPSLEIIADDVSCTHGATISDLSEEELFYLRSRGLDKDTSRNLQLFAFVDEISKGVNKAVLGTDEGGGLAQRLGLKLQRIIPRGERKVKGEFQSS